MVYFASRVGNPTTQHRQRSQKRDRGKRQSEEGQRSADDPVVRILAIFSALREVSFITPADCNETAFTYAYKLRGFVRISPEIESSKIQKPDNKPITSTFVRCFSGIKIACKAALAADMDPAGLEPAIL